MTRVLQTIDVKSNVHLVGRLGLLQWLGSLMNGQPRTDIFSEIQSKLALVKFAHELLARPSDILDPEMLASACTKLAQPFVDFTETHGATEQELIGSCSNILCLIGRAVSACSDTHRSFLTEGLSASSLAALLKKLPQRQKRSLLLASTSIPLSDLSSDTSYESVGTLYEEMFELLFHDDLSERERSSALDRLLQILHPISTSLRREQVDIWHNRLLSIREQCSHTSDTRLKWRDIAGLLTDARDDRSLLQKTLLVD
jgi:hypothetical protein